MLIPRMKWKAEQRNLKVNDIVMVAAEISSIRGKWLVGRVLEVYPGSDGKVRNVCVRTAKGTYQRPVTKVAVIYPAEGYDD